MTEALQHLNLGGSSHNAALVHSHHDKTNRIGRHGAHLEFAKGNVFFDDIEGVRHYYQEESRVFNLSWYSQSNHREKNLILYRMTYKRVSQHGDNTEIFVTYETNCQREYDGYKAGTSTISTYRTGAWGTTIVSYYWCLTDTIYRTNFIETDSEVYFEVTPHIINEELVLFECLLTHKKIKFFLREIVQNEKHFALYRVLFRDKIINKVVFKTYEMYEIHSCPTDRHLWNDQKASSEAKALPALKKA